MTQKTEIKRHILIFQHIKKLEEEIDMLRKQKMYLQSKLREKMVKKKKKSKNKTWIIVGYYYDGKDAYTLLEDKYDWTKQKMIKGIA
jgi:hypothetical protein